MAIGIEHPNEPDKILWNFQLAQGKKLSYSKSSIVLRQASLSRTPYAAVSSWSTSFATSWRVIPSS